LNKTGSDTHTITPTTLTYGGEALGRLPDGRAVFVPFALPGETVRIRLVEEKRNFARGELVEVLDPSPQRIEPVCPHFTTCGGCHYQHLPYEAQLAAKQDILRDQLERIGKLHDIAIQPTVPSPQPLNYRNHVQFHLAQDGRLGYHKSRSDEVLPILECHLPEEPLNILWPQLDFEAIPGLDRIGLRMGSEDDIQLILESDDPQPPQIYVEDLPISVIHLSPYGSLVLAGSDCLIVDISGYRFQVSAGSFFQVNTAAAELLAEYLLEELAKFHSVDQTTTITDVYCGVGLFSAFLAPHVGRLVGIESNPSAAEDFIVNLDAYSNVELYEAPANQVLPQVEVPQDVMIVDPPRSGLDRQTMDAILGLEPKVLVYISCDPATLARDAKRLTMGGFLLKQITPFDLFPQTYHIESISFWTR